MTDSACYFISLFIFVLLCILITVVTITQTSKDHEASFRFKFYNPLSYKTLDAEGEGSGKGHGTVRNYYANPNHSVWDELLSDPNDKFNSSIATAVYRLSDFRNEEGVTPPYWSCLADNNKSTIASKHSCDVRSGQHGIELGPCYAPHGKVDWSDKVEQFKISSLENSTSTIFPIAESNNDEADWSNYCRPGFIIIGAGKCGTSSLYHYITDHPRVLPAKEKQIHYFRYYPEKSLQWYYGHFPTTTSFLSAGALMTGEASPGYLPYPDVVQLLRTRITSSNNEHYVGPKIITVGREPIDRAYSSYRYNYVTPTLESIRRGRFKNIPSDYKNEKPDSFYNEYLFTFEEMIRAELDVLNECLSVEKNGSAITGAAERWGNEKWIRHEFIRRSEHGLPPLAVTDEFCYGTTYSKEVPRRQWAAIIEKYPKKVIDGKNVHLKQAMIGRGLYVLPLEWWYGTFPSEELFFVCTEDMSDEGGTVLNQLGDFLGLPEHQYNFSSSIAGGAYNVAGNQGYDKEVPWSEVHKENASIPLSPQLRAELEEFFKPYNERLFKMVGRRCNW